MKKKLLIWLSVLQCSNLIAVPPCVNTSQLAQDEKKEEVSDAQKEKEEPAQKSRSFKKGRIWNIIAQALLIIQHAEGLPLSAQDFMNHLNERESFFNG